MQHLQVFHKADDDSTIDLNRVKRGDRATANEKDGRARIVDPPRYEEVGITGLMAAVMTMIIVFKFKKKLRD